MCRRSSLTGWLGLVFGGASTALGVLPPVRLQLVVERQLQAPTSITSARDGSGRLFVAEQRGGIRIVKGGVLLPTPFLTLSDRLVPERAGFDERGLLGLTFHPQFGQIGTPGYRRFYVFYSAPSPGAPGTAADPIDCRSTVSEFRVSTTHPDLADPSSERVVLSFDKPQFNNNGGQLEFGPDGRLYIATGDGGGVSDNDPGHTGGAATHATQAQGNAQDMTSLLGKILRIAPLGTDAPGGQFGLPADNPFIGTAGARPEIWATGLHTVWRFSFDRTPSGLERLFAADVGEGEIEEINLITRGGNYGWRNREGTFTPSFSIDAPAPGGPLIDPIAQYAHPGVVKGVPTLPTYGVSLIGGSVYRGSALPGLVGTYVCADWSQNGTQPLGTMLALEENAPSGNWTLSKLTVDGGNPVPWFIQALGTDESGEIYLAAKKTRPVSELDDGRPAGALFKIVPVPVPPTPVSLSLTPTKDATIYSEVQLANGKGKYLFSGRVALSGTGAGALRRALLQFDLTSVPAGAVVQSAALSLTLNKTIVGPFEFSLHRVTQAWSEGPTDAPGQEGNGTLAQAGDVTWNSAIHPGTPWTPGGAFTPAIAAHATVSNINGPITWADTGLNADLQAWINGTAPNHGWILIGDETTTTAKRFISRENTATTTRPKLTLTYLPGGQTLTHRQQWEQQFYYVGEFIDDQSDLDGDGLSSLVEYSRATNPKAADAASNQPVIRVEPTAGGGRVLRFSRDPLATDLTYQLQTTPNLQSGTWTTVAESVAGAVSTGVGVSEAASAPLITVTLAPASLTRAFFRLRLIR
jgi:glucose/arabinose dehydrogenase